MDYKSICLKTCELARKVGDFIASEREIFSSDLVEVKGKNDFVSKVDKGAEERLIEGLAKILPESGFIAEEGTSDKKGDIYNWIVDPLDGTTNFIHGAPPYAISIGLLENNNLVVGVVFEVSLNECFYAWKDGGAFLNGKSIRVSETKTVANSLIATGFPYYEFARLKPFMKTLDYFFNHSHGVRRLGSAATDLAYVACGRYDAFYEYNLNAWDVAAGAFIVIQAGGKVADFKGEDDFIFGGEVIASNSHTHQEFIKTIGDIMNVE